MTNELSDLAHNVRVLRLELQKLELNNRITQLKAEPTIDEECVGCCKVVDVAANLQKELDECDGMNSELVDRNHRITVEIMGLREQTKTQATTIEDLLRNDERMKGLNRKNHTLIEGLEAELHRVRDNFSDLLAAKSVDITGLRAELSARKQDSEVLTKVVDTIRCWESTPIGGLAAVTEIKDIIDDYLDAPEGPPSEPVCSFCGRKNPSVLAGGDWFCDMECVKGQADMDKSPEITVTFAWLELP